MPNVKCECAPIYLDSYLTSAADPKPLSQAQLKKLEKDVLVAKPFGWNSKEAAKHREKFAEELEATYAVTGKSGLANIDRLFRAGRTS